MEALAELEALLVGIRSHLETSWSSVLLSERLRVYLCGYKLLAFCSVECCGQYVGRKVDSLKHQNMKRRLS